MYSVRVRDKDCVEIKHVLVGRVCRFHALQPMMRSRLHAYPPADTGNDPNPSLLPLPIKPPLPHLLLLLLLQGLDRCVNS